MAGWKLNGAVTGLASPVAQFTYRAEGDAAEVARLVHYHELKSGAVQLNGQGTYRWDRGEYAVVGQAKAMGVGWADDIVRLEKMNGGFLYSLDREHFNVSSIFATALGGTVHGKMDASHLPGQEAVGQMDLQVTGVELESALRAFASTELPLQRLPLSGSTGGTLLVKWQGSPLDATMDGNLRVQPVPRAGQLPVTAVVQATVDFKSQSVQVHNLDASTPETHLLAQGRLAASSDLNVGRDDGEAQRTGAAGGLLARQPRARSFRSSLPGRLRSGEQCRAGWSLLRWPGIWNCTTLPPWCAYRDGGRGRTGG